DIKIPDIDGLSLLNSFTKDLHPSTVIMMTAYGSINSAVEAMKKGAFDYLTKPLEKDELLIIVKRAFEKINLEKENRILRQELEEKFRIDGIVGSHGSMQEIFKLIKKVSNSNSTVLIYGESGTGKELIARAIHYNSPRRKRPFMAINCASIPETLLDSELFGFEAGAFTGAIGRKIGLFEASNGSTLFLDEIGDLSPDMQAKILRALQEREIRRLGSRENIKVDVRIISATNKDLEKEMKMGRFREDLFYRLQVIAIMIPPLRERYTDIPELITHFIEKNNRLLSKDIKGISEEALRILLAYQWPGNVRQLESIIERAVLLTEGRWILPEDLPVEVRNPIVSLGMLDIEIPDEGISLEELEKRLILKAMEKSGGVITKAAKLLGISFRTLQYRLEKFDVKKESSSIPNGIRNIPKG
ncbi:MAG: sigma-54-dependent Fis family transcriptional regulator, partial [Nitrospirae bacterium]|nr:sigma-54-dependent Fis family transcriptional regulator [Nitrospirota bacterium]